VSSGFIRDTAKLTLLGMLCAVCSGDKGTPHAAFNGKLMAIIQSTTTAGMVTVTATSGSGGAALTSGSASIMTRAP
jgi:hypothetical protein